MRKLIFIGLLLCLPACHKRVVADPPLITRPEYNAIKETPRSWLVLYNNDHVLPKAKRELGCQPCVETYNAKIVRIERAR